MEVGSADTGSAGGAEKAAPRSTGGVHGPGLLIITDVGPEQGDNTDGLFSRV